MQQRQNLQQLKECYNDTFFSTQVSSRSPLNQQSSLGSKNFFRISSKLKDEPRVYFKKMKAKKQEAEQKCLQVLRNNVRVRSQLERVQRDVAVCRNEFMKLYHNKKFKLMESDIMNEFKQDAQYSFRLSKENFMRKKMYNELSVSLRKQKRQREIQMLRQTKRYNDKIFRQTLKISEERLRKTIFQNTERVRQHKVDLAESKKKLKELSLTKSKFNYMSKVNEQMKKIFEYNQRFGQQQDYLDDEISNPQKSAPATRKNNQQ